MRKVVSFLMIFAMIAITIKPVYASGSDSAGDTFMGTNVSGTLSITSSGASAGTYASDYQYYAEVTLTYKYINENTGKIMTIEQVQGGSKTAIKSISLPSGSGLRSYKAQSIHKITRQNNIWQRELSAYN